MKKIISIYLLITMVSFSFSQLKSQSILMNERKIDRPLTLHKGQFQVNPNYGISIISQEFDDSGNMIDLTTNGTASVLHRYLFNINYGITDFAQISLSTGYDKKGERDESRVIILSNTDPIYSVNYFDEYKGFEDLYLGTIIKAPFKSRKFELAITPGIYLPIFSNDPDQPEHSISQPSDEQPFIRLLYHNKFKPGNGVTTFKIGAISLFRATDNISLSASVNYTSPTSEGETYFWINQLSTSTFTYKKIPFKYLPSQVIDYEFSMGYQAISWFNLSISCTGESYSSGWSEKSGIRIENQNVSFLAMSLGYEIQVTDKIWLTQVASLPIIGKNYRAPFTILTGITYNFFPGMK